MITIVLYKCFPANSLGSFETMFHEYLSILLQLISILISVAILLYVKESVCIKIKSQSFV